MRTALLALVAVCTFTARAATIANDDTCDISVLPAATLLLPYFEVDLEDTNGETTLFTVTNVTNFDQIAHVTLWTDYGFPVIDFDIYLTGYDVQPINLFDVIGRGVIAPNPYTSAGTGTALTRSRGTFSDVNRTLDLTGCARLAGVLDGAYVVRMQEAFTRGTVPAPGASAACARVGGVHGRAVGYATVDVVGSCSATLPTEAAYWTDRIRYDNVLIGDYQQIDNHENFVEGGSMVHIRAIPEGSTPAQRMRLARYDAGFERTFYSRYQAAATPHLDGRQPLPSTFATRWISGGPAEFRTAMKVWREGPTDAATTCDRDPREAHRRVNEVVVFDENENGVTLADDAGRTGVVLRGELPSTSRTSIDDSDIYPRGGGGATAGWIYLNLDDARGDATASQNWVITSMRSSGRFATDVDAIALGNGCSAPAATSGVTAAGGPPIGPAPDGSVSRTGVATAGNDDSCDIALLPAATLLLPYFEVDLASRTGQTTLVTVTNVSPKDQIARVTLWTDSAYPILTFNVYLTGYDVQRINLYDVIKRGLVAPEQGTGTRVTARGEDSSRNEVLDLTDCGHLPGALPPETLMRMERAFTLGRVPAVGSVPACNTVGGVHDNAVGYATIDVVRTCSNNLPTNAAYWSEDLLYDNVLIGDYQQVDAADHFAQGATMVHIRAIPEGGTPATRDASPFARTFYRRYQSPRAPDRDGRQPLPATFAARWIQGGTGQFQTTYKLWREGTTGTNATCAAYARDGRFPFAEIVRFDEAENGVGDISPYYGFPPLSYPGTAATSLSSVTDTEIYPQLTNGAQSGWMYLNLDDELDGRATSNWVVTSMRARGRDSVDMDAAALGNGCSRETYESEVSRGTLTIGPAPNEP